MRIEKEFFGTPALPKCPMNSVQSVHPSVTHFSEDWLIIILHKVRIRSTEKSDVALF